MITGATPWESASGTQRFAMVDRCNRYLLLQLKVHTQFDLVLISTCLTSQCSFFPARL